MSGFNSSPWKGRLKSSNIVHGSFKHPLEIFM